jgi:methyl-accepting chemotaxis protein
VEEMAAAASSLKSLAGDLVQSVEIFRLNGGDNAVKTTVRAPTKKATPFKGAERRLITSTTNKAKPAAAKSAPLHKPTSLPKPVVRAKATSVADDDWETF